MGSVILTIKIMPTSPEVDLGTIRKTASQQIDDFADSGEVKAEEEPVAFGLKALKLTFVMDEDKGSTEELEKKLAQIENVNSVEVVDVRRTVG